MAKYYSSIFGKISGKHGSAVAVIRKDGTTYLRQHVPASNPRTEKQQAHRAKFALTSKSLVPFNPIFKKTIDVTNGISTARSYAFKNAIVGEYPNLSLNYEKLMFSFGTLEKLHNASYVNNEGVIVLNWDFSVMYNCHEDDNVSLVVFNKNTKQSLHFEHIAVRKDKMSRVMIHDSWADSELYLWAYVTQGNKSSDSVFVGECDSNSYGSSIADNERVKSEIDECEASTNNYSIKIEQFSQSINNWFNNAIVSLIMMVCNILSVFKDVATISKIADVVDATSYKGVIVIKCVDNSSKKRVYKPNLVITRGTVFKESYLKYMSQIKSSLIPIIGSYWKTWNITKQARDIEPLAC